MAIDTAAQPSPPPRLTQPVLLALGAVYVIWGSTYLAMRIAVEALPPVMMASARFLVVGALMLLFLRARGASWPTRQHWGAAFPVGVLMFACGNATVAIAEKHITSGIAAVVCGTMPLFAGALGRFFGERTTAREWLGLVLGFLGVAVLGFGKELKADPVATALLFVAPVSWALGSLLSRRLPLAPGLMSAATQMVAGGLVMAVVSALMGEHLPARLPWEPVAAWVYLAVFGSLVAYSAYTYLLRNTRPAVATSYSYVNPAIAVVMGAALGGEHVGPETVVSVLLIIAATVLVVLGRSTGK